MELERFLPNDKSILNQLDNNNNEDKVFDGSLEDFLKLPMNEDYKKNKERIERSNNKNLNNNNGTQ